MKQRVLVIGANHLECERLVKIFKGNAEVGCAYHVQKSINAQVKLRSIQPHIVMLLHFNEDMISLVFRFCPETSIWLKAPNTPEWIKKGLSESQMPVLTKKRWEICTNVAKAVIT